MPDIFIDNHTNVKPLETVITPVPEKITNAQNSRRNVTAFSTFVRDPLGVTLAEQHEDEHILLFIRRAFVTNIPWILLSLLLLIIPPFIPFLFSPLNLPSDFITPNALIIFILFYYLVVVGIVVGNFLTWFYDIGLVTEKRAVDIDFYNISFVSVATARVQDLKDVRYAQKGFFQSFFDYGDVTVVVEASGETLTFEDTPRPAEVVSILSVLIGGHQE